MMFDLQKDADAHAGNQFGYPHQSQEQFKGWRQAGCPFEPGTQAYNNWCYENLRNMGQQAANPAAQQNANKDAYSNVIDIPPEDVRIVEDVKLIGGE